MSDFWRQRNTPQKFMPKRIQPKITDTNVGAGEAELTFKEMFGEEFRPQMRFLVQSLFDAVLDEIDTDIKQRRAERLKEVATT